MAYAFEKIMSQVDPNKINLFGGQSGEPQAMGAQATGQPETKTEAGGAVETGGGAGAQVKPEKVPSEGAAGRAVGTQRAFEASQKAGPVSLAKNFAETSQGLQKRSQDLQAEANKYASDADLANDYSFWIKPQEKDATKIQNYLQPFDNNAKKIDNVAPFQQKFATKNNITRQNEVAQNAMGYQDYDALIRAASSGDIEAGKKLSDIVNKTTINAVPVWNPQTDFTDENIDLYGSMPGVQKLLFRQFGPGYTSGMATFDAARLMGDKEYQNQLAQVKQEQENLIKLADSYKDTEKGLEATEKKEAEGRLQEAQSNIKESLGENLKTLETSNEQEFKDFQQDVKDVLTVGSEKQKKVIEENRSAIQKRIEEIVKVRPDLAKYLTQDFINGFGIKLEDFVRGYSGEVTAEDFYDQGEAEQFNRIMGWLGKGGQAKMPGMKPKAAGYLDVDAYTQAIQGAAEEKNRLADVAARKAIADARARASAGAGAARGQISDPNLLASLSASARASLGRGDIAADIVDPNQFFRRGEVSGSDLDYLDPNDVAAVRSAYEELMTPQDVQAGRLFNAPAYSFDEAAYKNAVIQRLNELAGPIGISGIPGPGQPVLELPYGGEQPGPQQPNFFEQLGSAITNPLNKPMPEVPKAPKWARKSF